MTKRVRLSRRARADLRSIGRYTIEKWGAEKADDYLGEINVVFERLAAGDRRGSPAPEFGADLMKTRVGSHVVFYRPTKEAIMVVRVLHARMDLKLHLL